MRIVTEVRIFLCHFDLRRNIQTHEIQIQVVGYQLDTNLKTTPSFFHIDKGTTEISTDLRPLYSTIPFVQGYVQAISLFTTKDLIDLSYDRDEKRW